MGKGCVECLCGRRRVPNESGAEEEWESGYNLVAVLLVSARQGKAGKAQQAGGEAGSDLWVPALVLFGGRGGADRKVGGT